MKVLKLLLIAAFALSIGIPVAQAQEVEDEDSVMQEDAQAQTTPPDAGYEQKLPDQVHSEPCTGAFLCSDVDNLELAVLPRRHSLGYKKDMELCKHMAKRSTPPVHREILDEMLVRGLIGIASAALGRWVQEFSDKAIEDGAIINGVSSAGSGAANAILGTARRARSTVYVCMRIYGHPVLPPGR